MKNLIILGLILSCGAFMETARVYGTSSFIARQMVEAGSYENKLNLKLTEFAKSSQCSPDVIQTVTNRNKALDEAQMQTKALQNAVTHNALIQGILWLMVIFVFVVMLLKGNSKKLESIG